MVFLIFQKLLLLPLLGVADRLGSLLLRLVRHAPALDLVVEALQNCLVFCLVLGQPYFRLLLVFGGLASCHLRGLLRPNLAGYHYLLTFLRLFLLVQQVVFLSL